MIPPNTNSQVHLMVPFFHIVILMMIGLSTQIFVDIFDTCTLTNWMNHKYWMCACVCSRYSCLQRKKSLSQQLANNYFLYTYIHTLYILVSSVVPLGKILLFRGFNNNKCPSCVLNIFCRTVLMIDYGFLFPSSIAIVIAQCDCHTWVSMRRDVALNLYPCLKY